MLKKPYQIISITILTLEKNSRVDILKKLNAYYLFSLLLVIYHFLKASSIVYLKILSDH